MSRTRTLALTLALFVLPAFGQAADTMQDHAGAVFHAIRLETDLGRDHGQTAASWDLDGWVGGDTGKLWLKSEGDLIGPKTGQAEVWALYSRSVSTFWDTQLGLRHDFRVAGAAKGHTYLVAGLSGLAPYVVDTQAHVFLRDDGAISARLRQENEILLTNRLILRPRIEANLNTRGDRIAGLGTGLTDVSLGLQTRYVVTRAFVPYVELKYTRKFGQTADLASQRGEKPESTTLSAGIAWLF